MAVMGPRRAVAQARFQPRAGRKGHGDTVGGEDQLLLETEKVHGPGPVGAVKGAEGLNFFRGLDQLVAQIDLGFDMLGAMTSTLGHDHCDLVIGDDRGRIAHLWDLFAQKRICVFFQEIRQFHDVAIRIIDIPRRRSIGHVFLPLDRAVFRSEDAPRWFVYRLCSPLMRLSPSRG